MTLGYKYKGLTLTEWAKKLGVPYEIVYHRYRGYGSKFVANLLEHPYKPTNADSNKQIYVAGLASYEDRKARRKLRRALLLEWKEEMANV